METMAMNKKQRVETTKLLLKHYDIKKSYLLHEFGLIVGVYLLSYSYYHSFLAQVNKVFHKASDRKVFFFRRPSH